MSLLTEDTLLL